MSKTNLIEPVEPIEHQIFLIRGQKVILDNELARIYGVTTKALNQAVRRNLNRFPEDFMFQLTRAELDAIISTSTNRSQFVTGSQKHRDPRFLPYVFTEHGALMAANVLKSKRAALMSVYVVRAFVKLREALAMHKDLAQKLKELEKKFEYHDTEIKSIIETIRQLLQPPEKPKRQIGFKVEEPKVKYRLRRRK
ncbi:MAG: ORF6N domain-containing protein [Bacteroidetes bacterium]|nr:ORF6N domain-containing protein [Bacteroidota bacterium]MBU2636592.1 ORF6N domain-containing protein [Bacteroidota bacterium]